MNMDKIEIGLKKCYKSCERSKAFEIKQLKIYTLNITNVLFNVCNKEKNAAKIHRKNERKIRDRIS